MIIYMTSIHIQKYPFSEITLYTINVLRITYKLTVLSIDSTVLSA